jgi:hypothetical protein
VRTFDTFGIFDSDPAGKHPANEVNPALADPDRGGNTILVFVTGGPEAVQGRGRTAPRRGRKVGNRLAAQLRAQAAGVK